MFYTKNVPIWERLVRVAAGMLFLLLAYESLWNSTLGVVLGLAGAMMAMTGLFGFCPMCALVGRKLAKEQ